MAPSPIRAFEAKLQATETQRAARDVFSEAIRERGYSYFDAGSMNATLLATPRRAANYFVCDYYDGDPWTYLPKTWPGDDPLTALATRRSTPIDYMKELRAADRTTSVAIQLGMLKMFNVKKAWLFPFNTLGHYRFVTTYICGARENLDEMFMETRDELHLLAARFLDHLGEVFLKENEAKNEAPVIVDKMPVKLTDQEIACISMVSRGLSNQEIASALHISENTVRYHLKKLYRKIGVKSRAEAVSVAIDQGLIYQ